MSQRMTEQGMLKAMVFTYYMGAAAQQAESINASDALREAVDEPLKRFRYSGDAGAVRKAVQSVLGQGWVPTGEWADAILKIGGKLL